MSAPCLRCLHRQVGAEPRLAGSFEGGTVVAVDRVRLAVTVELPDGRRIEHRYAQKCSHGEGAG